MKNPTSLILISFFSTAFVSQAAIIAEFEFSGPGAADTSITTSDFASVSLDSLTLNGLSEDASRGGVFGITGAGTSPTDNIEFVFSLNPGETFDFESSGSLSFDGNRFNGGNSASEDFFRTEITAGANTVTLGDSYVDDSASYSLAGLGLSGTNSIILKIYVARESSWNDASIDNLSLQGAVIPEPSHIALLFGGAALGALIWRRRK